MPIAIDYTHVLVTHKSQNIEILFRATDGIMIGMQKAKIVVFGERPNFKDSRTFMEDQQARDWLRFNVARADIQAQREQTDSSAEILKTPDKTIMPALDIRDGEGLVVLPPDAMELTGGAIRRM